MKALPIIAMIAACSAGIATHDAVARQDDASWGGAWGYATSPATKSVKDTLPAGSYRYRIRSSQSGDGVRLTFTNPAGALPLDIRRVTVAVAASGEGFALRPETERPVMFEQGPALLLAAAAVATSQPVDFALMGGSDLIVTVETGAPSTTVAGNAGFPLAFSDAPIPADGGGLEPRKLRPFVTLLAVRAPSAPCTIVTLGDSITEGAKGVRPGWRGWPGTLARRLVQDGKGAHCGVVNMGISGNRLLREGRGTAAVDRFERDVASVPGVTHLVVLEGINDIWRSTLPGEPPLSAAELIAGYRRIIDAAHARGIRIIGGTITPGLGWKAFTPDMEIIRREVNAWIRKGGSFDAVIDFDAAIRDSNSPPGVKRQFDSGDHLHPSDNGYEAMGRAISLSLFKPAR